MYGLWTEQNGSVSSSGLPSDTAILAGGSAPSGSNVKGSGNLWNQTPAGGMAPGGTGSGYIVALATVTANAFDQAWSHHHDQRTR